MEGLQLQGFVEVSGLLEGWLLAQCLGFLQGLLLCVERWRLWLSALLSGFSKVQAATQGSLQSFQGNSDLGDNLGDSVWDMGEEEVTSTLLGHLKIPTGDLQEDAGKEGQGKKVRKNKSNPEVKNNPDVFPKTFELRL